MERMINECTHHQNIRDGQVVTVQCTFFCQVVNVCFLTKLSIPCVTTSTSLTHYNDNDNNDDRPNNIVYDLIPITPETSDKILVQGFHEFKYEHFIKNSYRKNEYNRKRIMYEYPSENRNRKCNKYIEDIDEHLEHFLNEAIKSKMFTSGAYWNKYCNSFSYRKYKISFDKISFDIKDKYWKINENSCFGGNTPRILNQDNKIFISHQSDDKMVLLPSTMWSPLMDVFAQNKLLVEIIMTEYLNSRLPFDCEITPTLQYVFHSYHSGFQD
jgi:hypothetical protein